MMQQPNKVQKVRTVFVHLNRGLFFDTNEKKEDTRTMATQFVVIVCIIVYTEESSEVFSTFTQSKEDPILSIRLDFGR